MGWRILREVPCNRKEAVRVWGGRGVGMMAVWMELVGNTVASLMLQQEDSHGK